MERDDNCLKKRMTNPLESSSSSPPQEVRKTSGGIVVVGSTKKRTTSSIAPITVPTPTTTTTAARSPTVPVKVGQATVIGMPVKPATLHPIVEPNTTSTTTTIYPSTLQIPTTKTTNITTKSKTNVNPNVTTTAASSPTTTTTAATAAAATATAATTGKAEASSSTTTATTTAGGVESKDTSTSSTTMATMEPLMNQTVISCVHNIFFLLQSYGALSYEQLDFNLPQKETKYLTDVLELLVECFQMIKYDKEDDVYYIYNGLPRPEFSPLVSSKKNMAPNSNKSILLHVMDQIDQTNSEIDESLERIAELKKAIITSTSDTGEQGVKELLTKFQSKYPNIIHDPVYATAMKNVRMDIPLPQKESNSHQEQRQSQSEKTILKTPSNTKRKTKGSGSNIPTKKPRSSSTASNSNAKSPKKQNIKKTLTTLPTKQNDSSAKTS